MRSFATQFEDRGEDAGQAARYFNPFLSTTRRVAQQLTADEEVLTEFLVNTSQTMRTLASRREDLASAIANTNQTASAIAAESESLDTALQELPTTIRRGNTTFVNLRSTLGDLDELVAESKPATKDLAPFLRELRPLVARARPTIRDLRRAVRRPGANNDLVELTRKTPRLQQVASPSLENTTKALRRTAPVLDFIRPYAPDLVGWFRDFGQGAANYDANGHFARIQPIFNNFQFTETPAGGLLTPTDPDNRLDGIQSGFFRRCPGAASQPAADGSAPFRDDGNLDCDSRLALPGP